MGRLVGALVGIAVVAAMGHAAAGDKGAIKGKVRLAKDFGAQNDKLYGAYLGAGSKTSRGDLYLQLCEDAQCAKVVTSKKIVNYLFSTGFPKDVTADGLPEGTFYARFGLDTQYSQEYGGGFDKDKQLGPYDIVQSDGADPHPKQGESLPVGTKKVTLKAGAPVDLGEAVLGTMLYTHPEFAPTKEKGWLLAAASGESNFRNAIKAIDLETFTPVAPAVPKVKGAPLQGDICGIVRGKGSEVYVVAVAADGAHVFGYDTATRSFAAGEPVFIPHPECKNGTCPAKPSAVSYPWLCRGAAAQQGAKTFLYLHDFKGAGSQTTTNGYTAAALDVTDLFKGKGMLVATYGVGSNPFFTAKRIFRGSAVVGDKLYLVEPSWSKQLADDKEPAKTHVYSVPIGKDGKLDFAKRGKFLGDTANDTCGSSNNWIPGVTVQTFAGGPKLFLGNDDGISIHAPDGARVGDVDTRAYGSLVTSFGLGPDGKTLYAMPNCKSSVKKAKVLQGVTQKRTNLDRHAVMVLDLASSGKTPALKDTGRDFDEDGEADGGVDLEFLYLKRDLLRWCETCTGVVPPTAYTGPEIAVGERSLFLRGTGIQGDGAASINSSGLGQVGDLGVYDLGTGRGVMFRGFTLMLDGPSARWGYDLEPKTKSRLYSDDVSVSAVLYVKK